MSFFFLKVLLELWTRVGPHLGLTTRERQSKDPDEGWGWVYKRDLLGRDSIFTFECPFGFIPNATKRFVAGGRTSEESVVLYIEIKCKKC